LFRRCRAALQQPRMGRTRDGTGEGGVVVARYRADIQAEPRCRRQARSLPRSQVHDRTPEALQGRDHPGDTQIGDIFKPNIIISTKNSAGQGDVGLHKPVQHRLRLQVNEQTEQQHVVSDEDQLKQSAVLRTAYSTYSSTGRSSILQTRTDRTGR
jgi:hypothetical protein